MPERVEAMVREVMTEAENLRRDVQAYEEARRREQRAYRVVGVVLVGAIAFNLVLIATARSSLHSTQDTVNLVRSCTTPDGACAQRSRAQTDDFRSRLLGVNAIITDCAVTAQVRKGSDVAAFRKCVMDRTGIDPSQSSVPVAGEKTPTTPTPTPRP